MKREHTGLSGQARGAGPFPAVVGLHGCAGMHDTTKQELADELVARGYVVLLVDSYATRGIDHACTSDAYSRSTLTSSLALQELGRATQTYVCLRSLIQCH